jgi:glycosyltransferase involved in cell wall biosynthesis
LIASPQLHPRLARLPVSVIDVGAAGTATGYIDRLRWEQRSLGGWLRRLDADLFHATWNYGVPWNTPCPAVVTIHDLIPLAAPDFGSRSFAAAFWCSQYVALARARRLIAVSHATATEIRRWAPWTTRRVSVVHEGVGDDFRPAAMAHEPPYLFYAGGFSRRKNIPALLAAYHRTRGLGLDLPLKLTGRADELDGESRTLLTALPAATRDSIQFLGRVDDSVLAEVYRGAAALVFPSTAEGFGFPPLEALASGVPVVTTQCGSIPEIVDGNAVFADPSDPDDLARAIHRVVTDTVLRQRLIDGGLRRAGQLTWTRAADATLAVYRECLRG